jgi:hypothetical protein
MGKMNKQLTEKEQSRGKTRMKKMLTVTRDIGEVQMKA